MQRVFSLIYSWIEHDIGRETGAQTWRLFFPFHEDDIRKALKCTGWQVIKEGIFPALKGSTKNAIPLSVMMKNLDRLEGHIQKMKDENLRELYLSRILTLRKLITIELPKPSFYAVLAER